MPSVHSRLSPSAAKRWLACPGSVNLSATVPVPESTESSKEGTTAHWVAERSLVTDTQAAEHIGEICQETQMVVTQEMTDCVQIYLDEVRKYSGMNRIEERVSLENVHADLAGTCDYVVLDGDILRVFDYKHGKGVFVAAEENPQLMIYAYGAVLKFASLLGVQPWKVCKSVSITIVQPRNTDEGPEVRSWSISYVALEQWVDDVLREGAHLTKDSSALNAGDHCKFCPALGICPAAKKRAEELVQVEFSKVITLPAPEMISPKDKGRILEAKKLLTDWLSAVEAAALIDMNEGRDVPGFKLVQKRSNRAWLDDKQAGAALSKVIGVEAFEQPKLISPAQAEKKLKAVGQAELVEMLTFKPNNGVTIAPESDRRKAVQPRTAEADFSDFQLPNVTEE